MKNSEFGSLVVSCCKVWSLLFTCSLYLLHNMWLRHSKLQSDVETIRSVRRSNTCASLSSHRWLQGESQKYGVCLGLDRIAEGQSNVLELTLPVTAISTVSIDLYTCDHRSDTVDLPQRTRETRQHHSSPSQAEVSRGLRDGSCVVHLW